MTTPRGYHRIDIDEAEAKRQHAQQVNLLSKMEIADIPAVAIEGAHILI